MELMIWAIIFVISLVAMVKSADWMLAGAEKIGLAFGLSSFVVGVVIVGLGTSFPEVVSSFAAILQGATEIVVANAVGSNIANILLVIGLSAVVGGHLTVTKNLIDLELPLLAISTLLFLGTVMDGLVTRGESMLLLGLFIVYFSYTLFHTDDPIAEGQEHREIPKRTELPSRATRRLFFLPLDSIENGIKKITFRDFALLVVGVVGLVFGAKYLIDAVLKISEITQIGTGVIALVAVALGTSLPELLVSVRAAMQSKTEVALGNIFGSNVFNLLMVVGLPGIFVPLVLDANTLLLGVPVMVIATFIFIISGISRRIHAYEGAMYLLLYVFFLGKLFGML